MCFHTSMGRLWCVFFFFFLYTNSCSQCYKRPFPANTFEHGRISFFSNRSEVAVHSGLSQRIQAALVSTVPVAYCKEHFPHSHSFIFFYFGEAELHCRDHWCWAYTSWPSPPGLRVPTGCTPVFTA